MKNPRSIVKKNRGSPHERREMIHRDNQHNGSWNFESGSEKEKNQTVNYRVISEKWHQAKHKI